MGSLDGVKLAVLGADEPAGREVVAQAMSRGYGVRVLLDEAAPFPAEVDCRVGDVRSRDVLLKHLLDLDAVISAISPSDGYAFVFVPTLLDSISDAGVNRIVIASGRGAFSAGHQGERGTPYWEHDHATSITRARHDLGWTVVGAPELTDQPARGSYISTYGEPPSAESIPRADFAGALLDAVERDDWVHQVVSIS